MRLTALVILLAVGLATGCATSPPRQPDDLCAIFKEKRGWYKDARKASERWGVPIGSNMAIMHQESRFQAKAKPPRTRFLWIFPGPRRSSAYGYSQAKNETWRWYQRSAGRWGADRDEFGDAIDFIAWYNHITVQKNKVAAHDTYRLYLAYHEGHGGFARGTFGGKAWLKAVASKVAARATRYNAQLKQCEDDLASPWWWPFS